MELSAALNEPSPASPYDVARGGVDQNGDPDPCAEHHATDGQWPRQRQHRTGGETLPDGTATRENSAESHHNGTSKMAPHFMIVIERLPLEFSRAPSCQARSSNDAQHAADSEVGEVGDV